MFGYTMITLLSASVIEKSKPFPEGVDWIYTVLIWYQYIIGTYILVDTLYATFKSFGRIFDKEFNEECNKEMDDKKIFVVEETKPK